MSRMTVNQRNQFERASLAESSHRPRTRIGRAALALYTVLALILLAVLTYAALWVFDGVHHLIVIGVLVAFVLGIAAWVYPQRRHV